MKNRLTQHMADASLLLVALIWGSGFIATEYALQSGLSVPMIMAGRFLVAALVLLPFQIKKLRGIARADLLKGALAGVLLCAAFFAQTFGQEGTSVSNSAFLTATNVVIVPLIAWTLTGHRPPLKVFLLSFGTLIGIGILTLRFDGGGVSIGRGDLIVLLSAVLFAVHIAYLSKYGKDMDAGLLTFLQMAVSAVLSIAALFILEPATLQNAAWQQGALPLIYLALFSTCLCFFIQTRAQQMTTAAKAAILLSTEGLFGSAFSILLGLEPLTVHVVLGGVIIIGCVILSEVDFSSR